MKDAFMKYIPLKFKISYSQISMLPFIQKKIGNAIKKHALLLRYNNCDYLMPSLSELKVS